MQCPSEDGNVGWALGLSQLILGLSWAGLGWALGLSQLIFFPVKSHRCIKHPTWEGLQEAAQELGKGWPRAG